jgi:protein involved in polysaccharide export with SLBB domain
MFDIASLVHNNVWPVGLKVIPLLLLVEAVPVLLEVGDEVKVQVPGTGTPSLDVEQVVEEVWVSRLEVVSSLEVVMRYGVGVTAAVSVEAVPE